MCLVGMGEESWLARREGKVQMLRRGDESWLVRRKGEDVTLLRADKEIHHLLIRVFHICGDITFFISVDVFRCFF